MCPRSGHQGKPNWLARILDKLLHYGCYRMLYIKTQTSRNNSYIAIHTQATLIICSTSNMQVSYIYGQSIMLPDQTKFITKFLVNRVYSSKFINSLIQPSRKCSSCLLDQKMQQANSYTSGKWSKTKKQMLQHFIHPSSNQKLQLK